MQIFEHDHPAWYDLSFDATTSVLKIRVPRPVAAFVEHEVTISRLYEAFDHSLRLPKFVNMGAAAWGFGMVASQHLDNDNALIWTFSYPCVLAYSEEPANRNRSLRIAHSVVSTMQVMFKALAMYTDEQVGFDRPQLVTVDELHTLNGKPLLATLSPAACAWLSRKRDEADAISAVQNAMQTAQVHMLGEASANLPVQLRAKAPKVLEISAMEGKLYTNGMGQDTSPRGATLVSEGLSGPYHQLVLLAGLATFCQTVAADNPDWERPVPAPQTTTHEGRGRLSHPPTRTD